MLPGAGKLRGFIAALLALTALFVLPNAVPRHASAAPVGHLHAVHHCLGHGHAAPHGPATAALSRDHGQGQPCGCCDDMPGIACCSSAGCTAVAAVPPLTPTQPPRLPARQPTSRALLGTPDGIPVDPALRPPRPAA